VDQLIIEDERGLKVRRDGQPDQGGELLSGAD